MLCLGGNLVFIYYRGSLNAALSIRREKYPFTSLLELASTNYKWGRN